MTLHEARSFLTSTPALSLNNTQVAHNAAQLRDALFLAERRMRDEDLRKCTAPSYVLEAVENLRLARELRQESERFA